MARYRIDTPTESHRRFALATAHNLARHTPLAPGQTIRIYESIPDIDNETITWAHRLTITRIGGKEIRGGTPMFVDAWDAIDKASKAYPELYESIATALA